MSILQAWREGRHTGARPLLRGVSPRREPLVCTINSGSSLVSIRSFNHPFSIGSSIDSILQSSIQYRFWYRFDSSRRRPSRPDTAQEPLLLPAAAREAARAGAGPELGRSLAGAWPELGRSLAGVWTEFGRSLDGVWPELPASHPHRGGPPWTDLRRRPAGPGHSPWPGLSSHDLWVGTSAVAWPVAN